MTRFSKLSRTRKQNTNENKKTRNQNKGTRKHGIKSSLTKLTRFSTLSKQQTQLDSLRTGLKTWQKLSCKLSERNELSNKKLHKIEPRTRRKQIQTSKNNHKLTEFPVNSKSNPSLLDSIDLAGSTQYSIPNKTRRNRHTKSNKQTR